MSERLPGATLSMPIGRLSLVFASVLASGALATFALQYWGGRALWFLPSGIAVAAMIRWGRSQWLPIFAAQLALELIRGRDLLPSLLVSVGLPAGALVTAWILEQNGVASTFTRRRDAPLFIVACLIGMLIPALIGSSTLQMYYPRDPVDGMSWHPIDTLQWWLNAATGALLLAPLLMAVRKSSFKPLAQNRLSGYLTAVTLVALVMVILFVRPLAANPGVTQLPIIAASIALIVFSRLRFDFVPTAAAAVLLTLGEALAFSFNLGSFRGIAPLPGLVALWSYTGAMIGTMLMMTILLAEQEQADRRRRQAERQLAAEAERNRLFLQNAGDGVHVLDTVGRIVETSKSFCALVGYSRDELIGMHVSQLHAQNSPAEISQAYARVLIGEPLVVESVYRRKNGTVFDAEIHANGFEFAGTRHVYASCRDLSEIKGLQRALVEAISNEQRRLGQEMHDGLGQELTGMSLVAAALATQAQRQQLPNAADLRSLASGLGHSIQVARGIVHGLSPLADTGGSLVAALEQLANANSAGGIRVLFTAGTGPALALSAAAQSHLYRIAQEAVQNSLKHAAARRIDIGLNMGAGEIRLIVADDGRGISSKRTPSAGYGMNTMRYRASALHGRLSIAPRPEGGTVVVCTVPNSRLDVTETG